MPRSRKKKDDKTLEMFDFLASSKNARDTLKSLNIIKNAPKNDWRGNFLLPANTFVEHVIRQFHSQTDIPLELPFFVCMSAIAAELTSREITIKIDDITLSPDIWTVILADSGAGKTFSKSKIFDWIGREDNFPDPASAARFIADFEEHNNGIFVRDEFGQFMYSIENLPQMIEMKDYLLRAYDNSPIERNTKNQEIRIEKPCINILGLTVRDTFQNYVTPESMIDGFAQRFGYVIARNDPNRSAGDYALYKFPKAEKQIKRAWESLLKKIKYTEYKVSNDAEEAFKQTFKLLFNEHNDVPTSFFRRALFKGIKYALIYHFMTGKSSKTIDATDMAWAARVVHMHLQDAAELIGEHDVPDFEKMVRRTEEVKAKCKQDGIPFNARAVIRSINKIRSANEANQLIALVGYD